MNEAISILLLFDGLVRMTIVVDEVKMKEHNHSITFKQETYQISSSNKFSSNIKLKKCSKEGPSLKYLGFQRHVHCECY
jgi:hypothetical protein